MKKRTIITALSSVLLLLLIMCAHFMPLEGRYYARMLEILDGGETYLILKDGQLFIDRNDGAGSFVVGHYTEAEDGIIYLYYTAGLYAKPLKLGGTQEDFRVKVYKTFLGLRMTSDQDSEIDLSSGLYLRPFLGIP